MLPDALTATEIAVLKGLANGLQSKEIATLIGRKVPTVEMYVRRMYAKLSVKSRAHLVAVALQSGYLLHEDVVADAGAPASKKKSGNHGGLALTL